VIRAALGNCHQVGLLLHGTAWKAQRMAMATRPTSLPMAIGAGLTRVATTAAKAVYASMVIGSDAVKVVVKKCPATKSGAATMCGSCQQAKWRVAVANPYCCFGSAFGFLIWALTQAPKPIDTAITETRNPIAAIASGSMVSPKIVMVLSDP
jgi:hypothetical protein